jgi:hypothetical protein
MVHLPRCGVCSANVDDPVSEAEIIPHLSPGERKTDRAILKVFAELSETSSRLVEA